MASCKILLQVLRLPNLHLIFGLCCCCLLIKYNFETTNNARLEYMAAISRLINYSQTVHLDEINRDVTEKALYIITPTYKRLTQQPDITRFAQTLMHVPFIHWIVIEDSNHKTHFISDLLSRMPFNYTHLNTTSSSKHLKLKVRGATQRNVALEWIKVNNIHSGVIYFADDDNSYDIRAFQELRSSKKIGVIPTGNIVHTGVSTAVVKNSSAIGWYDVWDGLRKYQVEMAGFAVNLNFWYERGAPFFEPTKKGYLENDFFKDMNVTFADLEPKAKNCTQVLVWHTKTETVKLKPFKVDTDMLKNSNVPLLIDQL